MPPFLPYGRQCIEEDDIAAVANVLRGDWLTTGPAVAAFEQAVKDRTGAPHAAACANGTAALHLAALALGLGPGDRVVVPTLTFLATANAARYVGADVIFADVDPDTGLLTPATFQAALDAADGPVKAVFPVHLNGQCVDMAAIAAIACPRGIHIVEDACHALGTRYADGAAVGSCIHADLTCFSFHPVKTVAMGEGGMVTAASPLLAERLMRLRSHGIVREADGFQHHDLAFDADGSVNPWYYEMPELGFNYRASDLNCALGLSQMGKLDRFAAARAALVEHYDTALAPLAPLVRPVTRMPGCRPVWHLYAVLIDFAALGRSRAQVMAALKAANIGTQVHYLPVHQQPYYRQRHGMLDLPGAESYYARQLSLPLFVGMTPTDVDRVAAALSSLVDAVR